MPLAAPPTRTAAPCQSTLRLTRGLSPALACAALKTAAYLSLLLVLTLPAAAQTTTYRVAGTVLSSLTDQPVQHASITLLSTQDDRPIASTTADERGRFTIPALPAGTFVLSGSAPGFLPTRYQQHGPFSTAILTGVGVDTESLTLTLHPLGSLFGTITDESSEPIRNAQVHLFRRDHDLGEGRVLPGRTATTDDLGHYEFPRLQPNTYFLAVLAQPWYAVHPSPAPQQAFGITGPVDPALDVAYPVTFYPGATEQARAQPISINGNQAQADIQLAPAPAVTLTVPRNPETPGQPIPQLRVSLFGQSQFVAAQVQQTPSTTNLIGIAPGDYLVSTPNVNGQPATDVPIHLSREAPASLPLTTSTPHTHLHLAIRTSLAGNLYATLIHPGDTLSAVSATLSPKGEADLTPAPGTYYLQLTDRTNRTIFLRDLQLDAKPLPDSTVTIAPNANLTLTAAALPGTHTLRGVVQQDGKPCPGAMLLLIPAESHPDIRTIFRQQSDLDGSFEIPALVPGPYLLLALQDAWDSNWRSPDFLARVLPHSTPVLIPNAAGPTVTLPHPIPTSSPDPPTNPTQKALSS